MIPSVSGDKQAINNLDQFIGSELSWAGEGSRRDVLALGTEDGNLFCSGVLTQADIQRPIVVGNAGEAINSIAFNGNLLGVSTRAEIVIIRDLPLINHGKFNHTIIDRGSHGIISMPSGNFIAPIGRDGLLFMEPREGGIVSTTVELKGNPLYHYKASVIGITPEGECVASVLRQNGLSVVTRNCNSWSGSRWTFSNLDIVDITSIATQKFPFGLAVIGIDNSIHFVRDIFTDRRPRTFRFSELSGKGYRVLCSNGHIFLLTSKCLYIFVDLASRFLNDSELDSPITVEKFPCDAVDANMAFDRDLLLLLPDRLKIINVAQFSDPQRRELSRKSKPQVNSEGSYLPSIDSTTTFSLAPINFTTIAV